MERAVFLSGAEALLAALVLFLSAAHATLPPPDAEYRLWVRVHEYRNPTSFFESLNSCCDGGSPPCTDSCDNQFVFCLRPADNPGGCRQCPFGIYRSDENIIFGDQVTFMVGEDLTDGVPNPLVFNINAGNVTENRAEVELCVVVIDADDPLDDDDPNGRVDRIFVVQNFSVSANYSLSTNYTGQRGYAELQLSFLLTCPVNYFGSDCTIFCVERDNELGHFFCDTNGTKVCREGYRDPASNCTECTLPGGCNPCEDPALCLNGSTCINTAAGMYECECPEGYNGSHCEIAIACTPNPCENNGECVGLGNSGFACNCSEGYTGTLCEIPIPTTSVVQPSESTVGPISVTMVTRGPSPTPDTPEPPTTDTDMETPSESTGSSETEPTADGGRSEAPVTGETDDVIPLVASCVALGVVIVALLIVMILLVVVVRRKRSGRSVSFSQEGSLPPSTAKVHHKNPLYVNVQTKPLQLRNSPEYVSMKGNGHSLTVSENSDRSNSSSSTKPLMDDDHDYDFVQ